MSNHRGQRTSQQIRWIAIVLVLTALALSSFWILQTMRRDMDNAAAAGPRDKPDYYVDKFTYVKMDENGQPRYNITGAKMMHFPRDDSFEVALPVITSKTKEDAPLVLRSERARIEDDNSKIHMFDNVNGNRGATRKSENMHLKTEYLLLLPDDDVARTDKPVEITMGASVMTGTGMIVDNATQQFRLLHDVHGFYQPRKR